MVVPSSEINAELSVGRRIVTFKSEIDIKLCIDRQTVNIELRDRCLVLHRQTDCANRVQKSMFISALANRL